jgi:hypothetical protein
MPVEVDGRPFDLVGAEVNFSIVPVFVQSSNVPPSTEAVAGLPVASVT